jgi:hypothetical protein
MQAHRCGVALMAKTGHIPQSVGFEHGHELVLGNLVEHDRLSNDTGVGKEHVETAIAVNGVVYNRLDLGLFGGIELPCMDVNRREESVQFTLVGLQIIVLKVTDVDGASTAFSVLVGRGTANTKQRVGTCYISPCLSAL